MHTYTCVCKHVSPDLEGPFKSQEEAERLAKVCAVSLAAGPEDCSVAVAVPRFKKGCTGVL